MDPGGGFKATGKAAPFQCATCAEPLSQQLTLPLPTWLSQETAGGGWGELLIGTGSFQSGTGI